MEETKQCPFCGEMIKINAKKCRFCGEWLETVKPTRSTTYCPYCGEEILEVAKKCKYCGEFLQNRIYDNTNYESNYVISQIANLQKVSNILWKIISVIMIIMGLVSIVFQNNSGFQEGSGWNAFTCAAVGIILLIIGIYNIVNIPESLPKMILNKDFIVVQYYEDLTKFITALVINLILFWLGALIIGFDLYIRHMVMENRHLFINNTR